MLEVCNAGLCGILLAAATVIFSGYCHFKRSKAPPGPYGLPLLGYLPFLGKNPAKKYYELSKKYGPVISLKLGPKTVIILNDYDSIQEALVKNGDILSGPPQLRLIKELYDGYGIVFREFDDDYKAERKFSLMTLRGFGFGKQSMENKILEETEYFFNEIRSNNKNSFNPQKTLTAAVSNVICNITLGSRFSYEDKNFKGMLKVINEQFGDKLHAFCLSILIMAPILRFIPPFTKTYKRFCADMEYIIGILREIVEEHKRTFDPDNSRDFIDEYLKEMQRTNSRESSFCEIQLCLTLRDLFIAGTETTSTTLRWALLLFAHRPDIQKKVHEEIQNVIGDALPSMRHAEEMPYTVAVIHELMRHRTLIPLAMAHTATENLRFRGYEIPKSITVLPNIWAVHHDPNYFKNPDDFLPQRFIDKNGKFVKDQHVMPFSVGPRYCLGEQLARMELFLFLTSMVQRLEVKADELKPLPSFHDGVFGMSVGPKPYEVSFLSR